MLSTVCTWCEARGSPPGWRSVSPLRLCLAGSPSLGLDAGNGSSWLGLGFLPLRMRPDNIVWLPTLSASLSGARRAAGRGGAGSSSKGPLRRRHLSLGVGDFQTPNRRVQIDIHGGLWDNQTCSWARTLLIPKSVRPGGKPQKSPHEILSGNCPKQTTAPAGNM